MKRVARDEGRPPPAQTTVVVEDVVNSDPSCGNTCRTDDPIRTGTGPSVRASRWKQLLVTVHDALAALDVRLGREPASTLTGPFESAPATRSRDRCEACRTSLGRPIHLQLDSASRTVRRLHRPPRWPITHPAVRSCGCTTLSAPAHVTAIMTNRIYAVYAAGSLLHAVYAI
jgi:hypothetical protein